MELAPYQAEIPLLAVFKPMNVQPVVLWILGGRMDLTSKVNLTSVNLISHFLGSVSFLASQTAPMG